MNNELFYFITQQKLVNEKTRDHFKRMGYKTDHTFIGEDGKLTNRLLEEAYQKELEKRQEEEFRKKYEKELEKEIDDKLEKCLDKALEDLFKDFK